MIHWYIKLPDGKIYNSYTHKNKKDLLSFIEYYEDVPWKTLYKQGYRCVKVKIVEVD